MIAGDTRMKSGVNTAANGQKKSGRIGEPGTHTTKVPLSFQQIWLGLEPRPMI